MKFQWTINLLISLAMPNILIGQGCVSGNCQDGFGKYVYEDGSYYEGNWVDAPLIIGWSGEGRAYSKPDNATYKGIFSIGGYLDFGIVDHPQFIYIGSAKKNNPDGYGMLIGKNGKLNISGYFSSEKDDVVTLMSNEDVIYAITETSPSSYSNITRMMKSEFLAIKPYLTAKAEGINGLNNFLSNHPNSKYFKNAKTEIWRLKNGYYRKKRDSDRNDSFDKEAVGLGMAVGIFAIIAESFKSSGGYYIPTSNDGSYAGESSSNLSTVCYTVKNKEKIYSSAGFGSWVGDMRYQLKCGNGNTKYVYYKPSVYPNEPYVPGNAWYQKKTFEQAAKDICDCN